MDTHLVHLKHYKACPLSVFFENKIKKYSCIRASKILAVVSQYSIIHETMFPILVHRQVFPLTHSQSGFSALLLSTNKSDENVTVSKLDKNETASNFFFFFFHHLTSVVFKHFSECKFSKSGFVRMRAH